MIVFLFTLCVIFYQSAIYNAVLILEGSEMDQYHSTDNMHIENKTFMKMAAIGTWLGDFITAWMVLDMMLQVTKEFVKITNTSKLKLSKNKFLFYNHFYHSIFWLNISYCIKNLFTSFWNHKKLKSNNTKQSKTNGLYEYPIRKRNIITGCVQFDGGGKQVTTGWLLSGWCA